MAPPPQLLRIPLSHFCRKAEWGLTQAGIPYEALDVPLWRMGNAWRANPRQGTVPVLRVPEGVLMDSHDILAWADAHRAPNAPPLYPDGLCGRSRRGRPGPARPWARPVRRDAYRALHKRPSAARAYGGARLRPRPLPGEADGPQRPAPLQGPPLQGRGPARNPRAIDRAARQLTLNGTGCLVGRHPTAADHAAPPSSSRCGSRRPTTAPRGGCSRPTSSASSRGAPRWP